MKIRYALFLGFCALATGAFAGMNPANIILPTSSVYGVPYSKNQASAMCVDCHSENPVSNSGTHFVFHRSALPATYRTTQTTNIEFLTAWTSTALSKFALPAPPNPAALSVTGVAGEMICESCHNLLKNVAGGNNLVEDFNKASVDKLCTNCHATQALGPPNHHPMSGNNVGVDNDIASSHPLNVTHYTHLKAVLPPESTITYPGGTYMGCAACHAPHGAAKGAGARILRKGYSASTAYPGLEVNLITTNNVPDGGDVAGQIKVWNTNDLASGITRQKDVTDVFGSTCGSLNTAPCRLVSNVDPLCDACHAR